MIHTRLVPPALLAVWTENATGLELADTPRLTRLVQPTRARDRPSPRARATASTCVRRAPAPVPIRHSARPPLPARPVARALRIVHRGTIVPRGHANRSWPTVAPVPRTASVRTGTVFSESAATPPVATAIRAQLAHVSRRTMARIAEMDNSAMAENAEHVRTAARAIPTTIRAKQEKYRVPLEPLSVRIP
jgi:hypothetical protein